LASAGTVVLAIPRTMAAHATIVFIAKTDSG
jgi:hypothetical protein